MRKEWKQCAAGFVLVVAHPGATPFVFAAFAFFHVPIKQQFTIRINKVSVPHSPFFAFLPCSTAFYFFRRLSYLVNTLWTRCCCYWAFLRNRFCVFFLWNFGERWGPSVFGQCEKDLSSSSHPKTISPSRRIRTYWPDDDERTQHGSRYVNANSRNVPCIQWRISSWLFRRNCFISNKMSIHSLLIPFYCFTFSLHCVEWCALSGRASVRNI